MEKLNLVELKQLARERNIRGFSTMRKADLIFALSSRPMRVSPPPKRRSPSPPKRRSPSPPKRRSPPPNSPNIAMFLNMYMHHGFKLSKEAQEYLQSLFARLAHDVETKKDFLSNLGFLGEACEEAGRNHKLTDKIIYPAKTVFSSNVLLFIVRDMMDLVSHATIENKQTVATVPIVKLVIENDAEFSAAFFGTPIHGI